MLRRLLYGCAMVGLLAIGNGCSSAPAPVAHDDSMTLGAADSVGMSLTANHQAMIQSTGRTPVAEVTEHETPAHP